MKKTIFFLFLIFLVLSACDKDDKKGKLEFDKKLRTTYSYEDYKNRDIVFVIYNWDGGSSYKLENDTVLSYRTSADLLNYSLFFRAQRPGKTKIYLLQDKTPTDSLTITVTE